MLKGICTPVCTPFTGPNQDLDDKAFIRHIDWMLESGIHIICVCGGTGEFAFLTREDRLRMAEIAAKRVKGKAKLLVQTSAIRTQDAIEFSKHAEGVGADAIMVLPPFFEGPNDNGVYMHYEQIAGAVKLPIMAYNIPVHSGYDITPAIFKRLSEIPTVSHIKDSTGDMMRIEQLAAQGANVFCGCDYLAPYALMAGAAGCFWGGSNFTPGESVRIYTLFSEGKFTEMLDLWKTMKAAHLFLWTTGYNPAVKAALRIMGHDIGDCRRPVLPLEPSEVEALREALKPLL
jgi:4-hydroxy-tetrahydrodipicolinate synthase